MNDLEQHLRTLVPAPVSEALTQRLAVELNAPPAPIRFADRCLLAAISAGTIAAGIILTLCILSFANATSPDTSPTLAHLPRPKLLLEGDDRFAWSNDLRTPWSSASDQSTTRNAPSL